MAAQSCHVSDAESEYVELPAVPFARAPSWKGLIGGPVRSVIGPAAQGISPPVCPGILFRPDEPLRPAFFPGIRPDDPGPIISLTFDLIGHLIFLTQFNCADGDYR